MKTYRYWLLLVALLSTLAAAAGPKLDAPAPQATIKTLHGKRIDTAALLGNVVIVTFWATWCQYCKQELSDLSDYYRQHAQDGLSIIAVSTDDADDVAEERERAKAYPFPVAMLADVEVSGYGRIWRMPLTFIIDRRGILRRDGWVDTPSVTRKQLDDIVTPLLREKN